MIIVIFVFLGTIFIMAMALFQIFKFDHPLIARDRLLLNEILLLSVLLMLWLNLAFMTSSSTVTCGVRRFGLSVSHVAVFTCLLIKATYFNRLTSENSSIQYLSQHVQVLCALLLIGVQVALIAEWMILKPPDVEWHLITVNHRSDYPIYDVEWQCNHTDEELIYSMIPAFILILLTFAVSCGSSREVKAYPEVLHLALASGLSGVVLAIWIPLYFVAEGELKHAAVCTGITANVIIILAAMFLPLILRFTEDLEELQTDADDPSTSNYHQGGPRKSSGKQDLVCGIFLNN